MNELEILEIKKELQNLCMNLAKIRNHNLQVQIDINPKTESATVKELSVINFFK